MQLRETLILNFARQTDEIEHLKEGYSTTVAACIVRVRWSEVRRARAGARPRNSVAHTSLTGVMTSSCCGSITGGGWNCDVSFGRCHRRVCLTGIAPLPLLPPPSPSLPEALSCSPTHVFDPLHVFPICYACVLRNFQRKIM